MLTSLDTLWDPNFLPALDHKISSQRSRRRVTISTVAVLETDVIGILLHSH